MLRTATAATVRLRHLVLAIAALVVVAAAVATPRASVSALPEFTPTFVEVQTEALGLSANEVEQMVTVPLEADLLNGVQGVSTIRSQSLTSLSRIVMVFEPGIDDYVARSRVQEKLTQSAALPQVSKPPTMMQPLSTESRLLMFTMEPEGVSAIETSVMARWTVRPRLMGIPGVANVSVWGNRDRQLQVQVKPEQLKARGVTLSQVVEAVGNAQIVSPLTFLEASTPGTGGFIETPQQRLQVRHVFDKFATPEQLGKIPLVTEADQRVLLSDVATVVEDHQPLIGDAVGAREGSLLVVVEKFPGANAAEVTAAVDKALDELRPGLGGVKLGTDHFRAVDQGVGGSAAPLAALGLGVLLAMAALWVWFRDWRVPVLVGAGTVAGTSAALLVVQALGRGLNLLSLAGVCAGALLLALDAVVAGRAPSAGGTAESLTPTRGGLGFATGVGLLTVVPLLVLQGRPGALLASLPLGYGIATVVAWVVGVTVVPALASLVGVPRVTTSAGVRIVPARVGGAAAAVVLVVLAVLAPVLLAVAPKALVPTLGGRDVVVSLTAAPGTSLPAMSASAGDAVARLRGVDSVQSVVGHVGRAVTGDQIVDVNSAELWVRLAPGADVVRATGELTRAVGAVPGVKASVDSFGTSRLRAVGGLLGEDPSAATGLDTVTGATHPLVVRVYGEQQDVLVAKADEIRGALASAAGVRNPTVVLPPVQDGIEITVDLERAKAHAVKPGDVRRAEAILVQGIQVGSVFQGQKVFDVIVLGDPSTRTGVEALANLWIDTPTGDHVRLVDVADVRTAKVPVAIQRDAVARYIDVVAGVDGDVAAATDAARRAVATVGFPLEHHAEVVTRSTGDEMRLGYAVAVGVGALLGVFLLLQAATASWSRGLVGLGICLAAAAGGGGVALVTGITLGTLLGVLVLLAVGAWYVVWLWHRSGGELAEAADEPPTAATLVGASLSMAALVLPAAVLATRPGMEVLGTFAWTVLGGLVTLTVATLAGATLAPDGASPVSPDGGSPAASEAGAVR